MPDQSMASSVANLTTVDVYELASSIGHQFEKMIDRLGTDSISDLMPMVIRALEYLEEMTTKVENENANNSELMFTVERLQMEKKLKAEEKLKFDLELEQIEERWKKDAQNQLEIIQKLQEENQKLNSVILQNKINESVNIQLIDEHSELQKEIERLQSIVHKQREELRSMEKDINQQTNTTELLDSKVKHLVRQNSENNRKTSQMEKLAQKTIFEKSLLMSQLSDRDRMVGLLKDKIKRLEESIVSEDQRGNENGYHGYRELLDERDALKVEVASLQRQLGLSKLQSELEAACSQTTNCDGDDDDDAPVQGPINKEPDEKLFPDRHRKQSGIRRFFKNLLTSLKSPSSSSLSSPTTYSSHLHYGNRVLTSSSSSPYCQLSQSLCLDRRNSLQAFSSSSSSSSSKSSSSKSSSSPSSALSKQSPSSKQVSSSPSSTLSSPSSTISSSPSSRQPPSSSSPSSSSRPSSSKQTTSSSTLILQSRSRGQFF